MTDLTPKQAAFVREYLVDLNASQAAIRAGYSPKTAGRTAHETLKKPEIQVAVSKALEARSARTEITADNVVKELAKLGFANMLDYITIASDGTGGIDLSKLTRDQAAAIVELTSEDTYDKEGNLTRRNKIKLADKRASLVDLGKHLGVFKDSGGNTAILIQITPDDARL